MSQDMLHKKKCILLKSDMEPTNFLKPFWHMSQKYQTSTIELQDLTALSDAPSVSIGILDPPISAPPQPDTLVLAWTRCVTCRHDVCAGVAWRLEDRRGNVFDLKSRPDS